MLVTILHFLTLGGVFKTLVTEAILSSSVYQLNLRFEQIVTVGIYRYTLYCTFQSTVDLFTPVKHE